MHRTRIQTFILAAVMACGFAMATAAEERELFSGAALLYTVPAVTVVYPAGAGQDRELNRISAERRAAYLRGRHNTETRVVADVEITAEDLRDHLLVLGWKNQLVGRAGQIALTETGWRFQGLERDFSHDLLFSWVSPFEENREFVFWSRIDPELDRYLVLPFFGSDWIVFDGYTVEQYGRFHRENLTWPPKRNTEVEIDNRDVRPPVPAQYSSEHYQLMDVDLGFDAAEAARVLEAREEAWRAATSALGAIPERAPKIKLFVYKDSDTKEALCDVHDARHHHPTRNELHVTRAIATDPGLHEDMHLIARQVLGPGYLTLFVEGLAVWAENQQREDELPVYAGMLADKIEVPRIAELLDEESMRVLIRNRIGFPVAGLFMAWLKAEAGADVVRMVYGQYTSDPAQLARTIGIPVDEIDRRFSTYVREQAKRGESEVAFRAETAKARHFGGLGDYERAVPALERALELRPDHLRSRYSLGVARLNLDEFDAAEAEFLKILDFRGKTDEKDVTLLTWYQLGDLYSKRGEPERARRAYAQVLELPDYRGVHERTREALAELDGK